ncbi:MAG: DNA-binding transcriptional LysR family regulator [Myxococcota bacterium]|jgi:DNA-binding transcriptional LysR family regulator
MDWNDLRYILAAHRARTLVGAAARLGVTHTTVGRRIRASEERMGVRLFDRTPDGLHVTPAGQDLVEVAERMEGEVLSVESRIMGRDTELSGPLRVSILDYSFWALHGAFQSFLERYPSVDLTITATVEPVSLTRRDADVVLRLAEAPPETLIGRRLGQVGFAVYASDALVDRIGADAGYAAYPWLGWDERSDGRWVDAWLAENAPGARIAVRIDESAIVRRQAIQSGMGVFFMPCFEGDAVSGLQRLGPVEFRRSLWLLTLPDLRHTNRVRAFLDHMAEAPSVRVLCSQTGSRRDLSTDRRTD